MIIKTTLISAPTRRWLMLPCPSCKWERHLPVEIGFKGKEEICCPNCGAIFEWEEIDDTDSYESWRIVLVPNHKHKEQDKK